MKEKDYREKLSKMDFQTLIEECVNNWIELQVEKDYRDNMMKEAGKCIDMESGEKEYFERKYLEEKHR